MCVKNVVILLVGFIGIMVVSPFIDQHLAILPYNVDSRHFYGEVSHACLFFYHLVSWVSASLITIPILLLVFAKKFAQPKLMRKFAATVLLALAIGPGLMVNLAFKDNWGRPRPYQVIRDGETYVPFWRHNFNSAKDNSFPSGHASIGFFLGVPFLALGRRRAAVVAGIAGGIVIGGVRILQGGHYFSDVMFAGVFVWLAAEIALYLINILDRKGYLGE